MIDPHSHGAPGVKVSSAVTALVNDEYLTLDNDLPAISHIRDDLDEHGVADLAGFLRTPALMGLQKQILELDAQWIAGDAASDDPLGKGYIPGELEDLVHSDFIVRFLNNLLGPQAGGVGLLRSRLTPRDLRAGVNIMRGPEDVKPLHFDGTYLNVMIPLVVPSIEGDRRGQLVIYPNIRSFSANLADRWLIPSICRFRLGRALFRTREVDYQPGDLYFFYGYRSLHGVMRPSEPGLRCVVSVLAEIEQT